MSGECINCITTIGGSVSLYHYHRGLYQLDHNQITRVSLEYDCIKCVCPPSVGSVIGARSDARIKRPWRKIKPISGCDLHLILLSTTTAAVVTQNGSIKQMFKMNSTQQVAGRN